MNATISPHDCTITTGPTIDGIIKIGLMIDDYHIVDDSYMQACYVASFILQRNVFARLGKLHVKSLSGIREKILFRQKYVNDMVRITVNYDGKSELMDEKLNLSSKMEVVKRRLAGIGLTFISEDVSKNGKPKFIYSFTVSVKAVDYPLWLEVQFSNESVTGTSLNHHVDYELKRLQRGSLKSADMRKRFRNYEKYQCVDDNCFHDINVIMTTLRLEELT
jgi:hypothetical protein